MLNLPPDMNISSTFNVENLTIYHEHYQDESFQEQAIRLPMVPARQKEIEDVYDDQLVSTKTGGYHKFLVKWKGKPFSEATWITPTEFERLNPDLYEKYQANNSPESSFSKLGRADAGPNYWAPLESSFQKAQSPQGLAVTEFSNDRF